MKRALIASGYAVAGVVLAVGLSAAAYAIAGRDLAKPARPVRVDVPLAPTNASSERFEPKPRETPTVHPATKKEDHATPQAVSSDSGSTSVSRDTSGDSHGGTDSTGSTSTGSDSGSGSGGPDD